MHSVTKSNKRAVTIDTAMANSFHEVNFLELLTFPVRPEIVKISF